MSLRLSVCVLTYNHERFIAESLESILTQDTPFAFEVIVGDDCSTDRTSDIVDRFADQDQRVRVIRPQANRGATQNLFAIHNAASGTYVTYFDGDDLMAPGKLAKQAARLDENPGLAACGHQMRVIDANGVETGALYPAIDLPHGFDLRLLIRLGLPVFPSSLMYRRVARTLTSSDFEIYDWYLFSDILKWGPASYIHEPLGAYRVHPASMASRHKGTEMMTRMVGLYRRRFAELPQYRADFMARALMWAWHGFFDEKKVIGPVWEMIAATATPAVVVPFVDAYLWAGANKASQQR